MKVLIDDHINDYAAEQIAQWMGELPRWRREQALGYKHDGGRRQSLLVYRLLCRGLREEYGIAEPPTFRYGEHGKPYLALGLYFSLSHCREAVACAIAERPVGIDIEAAGRKISDSLVRHTMNDEEIRDIEAAAREGGEEGRRRAFLRLWTQKEAVVKLLGTGIRDDMRLLLTDTPYCLQTQETERWIMSTAEQPPCAHQ